MSNTNTGEFRAVMAHAEVQDAFRKFLRTEKSHSKQLAFFEFWLSCRQIKEMNGSSETPLTATQQEHTESGCQVAELSNRFTNNPFFELAETGERKFSCETVSECDQYRSNSAPTSPQKTPDPCSCSHHEYIGNHSQTFSIQEALPLVEHYLSAVVYPDYINSVKFNRLTLHTSEACGSTSVHNQPGTQTSNTVSCNSVPSSKLQDPPPSTDCRSTSSFCQSSSPHDNNCRSRLWNQNEGNLQCETSEFISDSQSPPLIPEPTHNEQRQMGCVVNVDVPNGRPDPHELHPRLASFDWARALFARVAQEHSASQFQPDSILDEHLSRVWPRRARCMILEDRRQEGSTVRSHHRPHRIGRLHRIARQAELSAYRRLDEGLAHTGDVNRAIHNCPPYTQNKRTMANGNSGSNYQDLVLPWFLAGAQLGRKATFARTTNSEAAGSSLPYPTSLALGNSYSNPVRCWGVTNVRSVSENVRTPADLRTSVNRGNGNSDNESSHKLPKDPTWYYKQHALSVVQKTWPPRRDLNGTQNTSVERLQLRERSGYDRTTAQARFLNRRSLPFGCNDEFRTGMEKNSVSKGFYDFRLTGSQDIRMCCTQDSVLSKDSTAQMRDVNSSPRSSVSQGLCVVCHLPTNRIPYVVYWNENVLSLREYKELVKEIQRRTAQLQNKRWSCLQSYRYFFKCASVEFSPGVVYQECCVDEINVPCWRGIVWGKVELRGSLPS